MENAHLYLERAATFHGHLGPYLALGLKMGLLGKNLLQGDPFSIRAVIHTMKTPPRSCILDGIQFSSGCTLGKGNISVEEDDEIYGIFFKDSHRIEIRVKPHIIQNLKEISSDYLEEHARSLFTAEDEEIFDVIQ